MPASPQLRISIGLGRHVSFGALVDGTVKPEGIDLTCVTRMPQPGMLSRAKKLVEGELDGGELSMSYFTQYKLAGAPLVALPVFPYRSFRHRSIHCREGSGIKVPADLKGKKMGMISYSASTMTWVRGILRDEYGIQPQDIHWYSLEELGTLGASESGVSIEVLPPPPSGVAQTPHIARMVENGELDGAVAPQDLTRPGIYRLFDNHLEVEAEYYRRTGIWPTIHTFVINERLLRDHPWAVRSLLEALRKSAALAPNYLSTWDLEHWDTDMWVVDRQIRGGRDPNTLAMGDEERRAVEAFWDYLILDRAIQSKPSVDAFFPPIA